MKSLALAKAYKVVFKKRHRKADSVRYGKSINRNAAVAIIVER